MHVGFGGRQVVEELDEECPIQVDISPPFRDAVAVIMRHPAGEQILAPRLGDIRCPLLVLTSRNDHVVPPSAADFLAGRVSGEVERVVLERSYHVATLDYDRAGIEARAVEFARSVTAG